MSESSDEESRLYDALEAASEASYKFRTSSQLEEVTNDYSSPSSIQREIRKHPMMLKRYQIGQRISALYTQDDRWYPAKILSFTTLENGERKYTVRYKFHGNLEELESSHIRKRVNSKVRKRRKHHQKRRKR
ncbi:unnamed protein product [Lepeophtheirus salmonis]|uniref:(salmon louse) hypothetical protein n=1 Tax=Lepeophtheirus salmonis TaxID=72036 RepID=A0A7R8CVL5_LEPSM|nr:unnamed protein product [Lepeophtheirus salmonis]CAF2944360.1 unnamed protein product [Lepeophtheirus salmonis]